MAANRMLSDRSWTMAAAGVDGLRGEGVAVREDKVWLKTLSGLQRGPEASVRERRTGPAPVRLTDAERERHEAFVLTLGAQAIWRDYISVEEKPAAKSVSAA